MSETADIGASREIASGVHWLPGCAAFEYENRVVHTSLACYIIVGGTKSLMFDSGDPSNWPSVEKTLDRILIDRSLDWIVPSHPEIPHSGNLARLFRKYPDARAIGDIRDYHLYYPGLEDHFLICPLHNPIELR